MTWVIKLDQVEVVMPVGICDFETTPQRVHVDVEMVVDYPQTPTHIEQCADYAVVYNYIQGWKDRPHTDLLETLASDLADFILNALPVVKRATCSVSKPDIFAHAKGVSVTYEQSR